MRPWQTARRHIANENIQTEMGRLENVEKNKRSVVNRGIERNTAKTNKDSRERSSSERETAHSSHIKSLIHKRLSQTSLVPDEAKDTNARFA